MARINTYNNDIEITGGEKVIGTDVSGAVTKNFPLRDIAKWMSNTGQVGVVGQSNYIFQAEEGDGRKTGSASFEGFGGDGSNIASIVTMVFSKYMPNGNQNAELMGTLINDTIMLARIDDTANFGIFTLLSWDLHPTEDDFYVGTFQLNQAHARS